MLGRIALRIAVVEALKGRTLVGQNVLDSEIGVLSTDESGRVTSDQPGPFIAVYTDTSTIEPTDTGPRALLLGGVCDLVLETGVTASMVSRTESGDKEIVEGLPATDAAFEMLLDIVVRDIADALLDPAAPWSKVFQSLAFRILKLTRTRVGHHQYGTRLAAQEMRLSIELIDEPLRAVPLPDGPFADLVALLASSADQGHAMFREVLLTFSGNSDVPDEVREYMGLSLGERAALGGFDPPDAPGLVDLDLTVGPMEATE